MQAHEEGRVVFFCGAGISFPAGLPGLKELVEQIYRIIGTEPNAIECEAFAIGRFDACSICWSNGFQGVALAKTNKPKARQV